MWGNCFSFLLDYLMNSIVVVPNDLDNAGTANARNAKFGVQMNQGNRVGIRPKKTADLKYHLFVWLRRHSQCMKIYWENNLSARGWRREASLLKTKKEMQGLNFCAESRVAGPHGKGHRLLEARRNYLFFRVVFFISFLFFYSMLFDESKTGETKAPAKWPEKWKTNQNSWDLARLLSGSFAKNYRRNV